MHISLAFVDLNIYAEVAWTSVYCKDQFCSKIHIKLLFIRRGFSVAGFPFSGIS
jgi:hypothetical protein